MKNVAFIPVRGGSKSIPFKNIKMMNQKPLVYWTMKAAAECNWFDNVYVATDSDNIFNAINVLKEQNEILKRVEVISRSDESATDVASTEFAMLEFALKYDFDNIALIQATSPLLTSKDLERGFFSFFEKNTDSVLSVVQQKRFNWKTNESGFVEAINYNIFQRPRRQEFDGYLVENGAFYITSKEALVTSKNRISGNIKAVTMAEETFFEIDELEDWTIIEALLKQREINSVDFRNVKMFLTDCDGCLTDGGMFYSSKGDELKKFNTSDGMGFQLLQSRGIVTGIITGENTEIVRKRAEKLKIDICELGIENKMEKVEFISKKYGVPLKNILYVGDDINDLDVLQRVGIPCCVNNAVSSVKLLSKYITKKKGGEGAIREIVDKILQLDRLKL